MKTVFLFYNSGSGGFVANLMIKNAIMNLWPDNEYKEIYEKYSNKEYYIPFLEKEKPDIIILQDFYIGLIEAAIEYKSKSKNKCKVLLFSFTPYEKNDYEDSIDQFFVPYRENEFLSLPKNCSYYNPPLEISNFKIIKNYNNRKKNICTFARLNGEKTNTNILEFFKNEMIHYDYYAVKQLEYNNEQYHLKMLFDNKFCNLYEQVSRIELPLVLNNYKFHILCSRECFSIITLEAMACGTIPILISNKENFDYELSWIPKNFGYKFTSTSDFKNNFYDVINDKNNYYKSLRESIYIRDNFNYGNFFYKVNKWITT